MSDPAVEPESNDEADPSAPKSLATTDPEWLTFEKDVKDLLASKDPNATVEHNVKRVGKSGRTRQIDTLVTGEVCGERVEIGVEAKRYKGKVGLGVVDAFVGKCLDTGVDKGVLYSHRGFDEGAVARAAIADHPKVVLRELPEATDADHLEDLLPPWSDFVEEFLGVEACTVGECYGEIWVRDDLGWSGGVCDSCGTAAGYCKDCGGWSSLLEDVQPCDNCDTGAFEVDRDHDTQEATDVRWVSMVAWDHADLMNSKRLT
ncbi:restriction endonuclease [Janibacter cremeus]|uniref:Restriction endonuclease type IV Mrr domain-containing protein n=1 Tax=Janibacter cremeus TaxID=1285192 RepID=A0A852VT96_9MICO|nr:hypothetical protein [Janibacter cremeus]